MTDTVPDDPTSTPSHFAHARALADLQQLQARHGLPVPYSIGIGQSVHLLLRSSAEVDAWVRVLGLSAAFSLDKQLRSDNERQHYWWYGADGTWPGCQKRPVYVSMSRTFEVPEQEQGPRPGEAA